MRSKWPWVATAIHNLLLPLWLETFSLSESIRVQQFAQTGYESSRCNSMDSLFCPDFGAQIFADLLSCNARKYSKIGLLWAAQEGNRTGFVQPARAFATWRSAPVSPSPQFPAR
jgi:hypothetical protein